MKIVLINGEKQSGKSTLAEHLANLLFENKVMATPYSFVGIYEELLRTFIAQIHGDETASLPYEDLKRMEIVPGTGILGRDWLIQMGNGSRALNPYLLPAIFAYHVTKNPEIEVWIIENWGFADELQFFKEDLTQQMIGPYELTTVSLTKRSTRKYECGETYDGDNRANWDCMADIVDPAVNDLAKLLDPSHDYPVDTIALQFLADAGMVEGSEIEHASSGGLEETEEAAPAPTDVAENESEV